MGLLDLFSKRDSTNEISGSFSSDSTMSELLVAGFTFNSAVNPDTAMEIPAVAQCVNMISAAVASLPVKLYRKENNKVTEITDDPRLTVLNTKTGDTMNADEMRRAWVKDYLLSGSAFGYIEKSFSDVSGIYYLNPRHVSVKANEADVIHKNVLYYINGQVKYPCQLLKILRHTDGFGKGKGIPQESPLILDTILETLRFQKTQVKKGGNKKGFLKASKSLADDAVRDLKAKWAALYSNNDNSERVMLLNNDMDFKEISATAVEMQINESVKTNNAEIMKLFGTCDGILSPDTVKNAVMPVLDAFEAAFDADLLREDEKDTMYFAFDTRELTRGNIAERYAAYSSALDHGFIQVDEVREMEDREPLGLDFIKLGLQDVLYFPKTKQIYTPNTNQLQGFGAVSGNVLTNNAGEGIIEERGNPNHAKDGKFTFGKVKMSKSEYSAVSSGIMTDHPNLANDSKYYDYCYGSHYYVFKVIEPGTYSFVCRKTINPKNNKKIMFIKENFVDGNK